MKLLLFVLLVCISEQKYSPEIVDGHEIPIIISHKVYQYYNADRAREDSDLLKTKADRCVKTITDRVKKEIENGMSSRDTYYPQRSDTCIFEEELNEIKCRLETLGYTVEETRWNFVLFTTIKLKISW